MTPAFVCHSKQHASAALSAAAQAKRDVTLLTPPGAAHHSGPEYLLAMYRNAQATAGDAAADIVIDCGDDAGTAMRALRCGWRRLVLAASPTVVEKVSDIALQLGGRVLRARPDAIDLLSADDPLTVCRTAFDQEAAFGQEVKSTDGGRR